MRPRALRPFGRYGNRGDAPGAVKVQGAGARARKRVEGVDGALQGRSGASPRGWRGPVPLPARGKGPVAGWQRPGPPRR